VEHDCSKVFVSARCIPQEVLYTPPRGGVQGGLVAPARVWEPAVPQRGSWAVPPKLKITVKLPFKSIVISSQSGTFIR